MKEKKGRKRTYHFTASLRVAQQALEKLKMLGTEDKLPHFNKVDYEDRTTYQSFGGLYEDIIANPVIVASAQEKKRTVIFLKKQGSSTYFPFVVKLFMRSDRVTLDDIRQHRIDETKDYEHCWEVTKVFLGRLCDLNYYGDGKQYVVEYIELLWFELDKIMSDDTKRKKQKQVIERIKNTELNCSKQRLDEFICQA